MAAVKPEAAISRHPLDLRCPILVCGVCNPQMANVNRTFSIHSIEAAMFISPRPSATFNTHGKKRKLILNDTSSIAHAHNYFLTLTKYIFCVKRRRAYTAPRCAYSLSPIWHVSVFPQWGVAHTTVTTIPYLFCNSTTGSTVLSGLDAIHSHILCMLNENDLSCGYSNGFSK